MALAVSSLMGAAVSGGVVGKILSNKCKKAEGMSQKHFNMFMLMNRWVRTKQEGKSIAGYLEERKLRKVAIYGLSYVGQRLKDELRGSGIEVVFGIDQRADALYSDVDIVTMDGDFQDVDAVIVTAVTSYNEIEEKLRKKVRCVVLSLEDILYEI